MESLNQMVADKIAEIFKTYNRSSIKIATLLTKLREHFEIDKESLLMVIEDADVSIGEYTLKKLMQDKDTMLNPNKLAKETKPKISLKVKNVAAEETLDRITSNASQASTASIRGRARSVVAREAVPKKSGMKKPTLTTELVQESPISTKEVPEMTVTEFISHIQDTYESCFAAADPSVSKDIIVIIKFVNTYINDFADDNKQAPNMAALKYFEIDSDISDEKITKYHYAPYLVNIAIGLISQQKTESSSIKEVLLNNIFRLLAIVCKKQDNQKEEIEEIRESFESSKKRQVGLSIPTAKILGLRDEFKNSADFLLDNE